MDNNGNFLPEDVLLEQLFNGQITRLQFVYRHSQERIDDYKSYCEKRGFEENEKSAEAYMDFLLKREEYAHTEDFD